MQGRLSDFDRLPRLKTKWPRRPYRIEGWVAPESLPRVRSPLEAKLRGSLRPVPGGQDDWYNPFKYGYYQGRGGTERRPLYAILWELDYKNPDALLQFAAEWGIPGTFLHQLQFAEYAEPITPSGERSFRVARDGDQPSWFRVVRRRPSDEDEAFSVPSAAYWELSDSHLEESPQGRSARDRFERGRLDHLGQLIPGRVTASRSFYWFRREDCDISLPEADRVAAFVRELSLPTYSDMALPEYYNHFFPDGDMPTPDSPVLFDSLSEPAMGFQHAVLGIRNTYALCVQAQQSGLSEEEAEELDSHFTRNLLAVTPGLGSVIENGKRKWEERQRFPSLLSAIYLMLLRDFTTPHRFLRLCAKEGCGRPVITDRVDRIYCSNPCKSTANTRNSRARQRMTAEAAKGETK